MREKMKERESRSVGSIILVMRRSPANLSSSLVSPSSSPTHRDSTILSTFTPVPVPAPAPAAPAPAPVSVAGVDILRDLVWKKEGGARLYCMAGLSVCPLFHMRCRCGDDIIVVSGWVVAGLSLCPFFFLSFFLFPLLLLFPWSPPVSCLLLPPASCLLLPPASCHLLNLSPPVFPSRMLRVSGQLARHSRLLAPGLSSCRSLHSSICPLSSSSSSSSSPFTR